MNLKHHLFTLLLLLAGTAASRADFATGFETSSGYGTNTTVIGVQDVQAPIGNVWVRLFGSSANDPLVTSSTANPETGLQALQLNDTSGSDPLSASLNLGSAFDASSTFTVGFGMALSGISAGTGNQAQVYLGHNTTSPGVQPYWLSVFYNDGALTMYVNNSTGTSGTNITLGNYTDFSPLGEYVNFEFTIDPTTFQYTSVLLWGTTSGVVDKTAFVQSVNGGYAPHLQATPESYLSFVTGSNDILVANFDDVYVTTIPEPSAVALMLLGGTGLLLRRSRRG